MNMSMLFDKEEATIECLVKRNDWRFFEWEEKINIYRNEQWQRTLTLKNRIQLSGGIYQTIEYKLAVKSELYT